MKIARLKWLTELISTEIGITKLNIGWREKTDGAGK